VLAGAWHGAKPAGVWQERLYTFTLQLNPTIEVQSR